VPLALGGYATTDSVLFGSAGNLGRLREGAISMHTLRAGREPRIRVYSGRKITPKTYDILIGRRTASSTRNCWARPPWPAVSTICCASALAAARRFVSALIS